MLDNNQNYADNSNINDEDGEYEVIRMDDQEPLNNKNCKHHFEKDSDEISKDRQAWTCVHCHRGTFLPKGVDIINS